MCPSFLSQGILDLSFSPVAQLLSSCCEGGIVKVFDLDFTHRGELSSRKAFVSFPVFGGATVGGLLIWDGSQSVCG